MPFTQRENISHFLTACENPPFNLPAHDRFLTVDLYDEKDPAQVIQCLGAFSRVANSLKPSAFPTAIGPKRGASSPTRRINEGASYSTATPSRPDRGFSNASQEGPSSATKSPPTSRMMSPSWTGGSAGSKTPESASRGSGPVSSWSKKTDQLGTAPAWNIHQYGYMGGASQGNQGVVFGAPRQITSAAVQVPSVQEKEQRLRQQQLEAERQAQRQREEEEQREQERRRQREAEEQRAQAEEQRRWEEETRKAKLREQEDAERARLEAEREREELRKAREEELRAVERDKEERRRREAQRREEEEKARKDAEASKATANAPRTLPSRPPASNAESDRVAELERQLAEAKERERQYLAQASTQPLTDTPPNPTDEASTIDDRENNFRQTQTDIRPLNPAHSGGPRPFPNGGSKPAIAPKPRTTPFARPAKPLSSPQSERQPPPPPRATAEPPSDDTNPSQYSSGRPGHVTRTDQYLSSNPAPKEEKPAEHFPAEMGMTSTSERDEEDQRRVAAQEKTKAGGWASKSLLEKEMERERERQREWEENQMAKARASGMGNRGELNVIRFRSEC